jgi:hypothetical protein
MADYQKLLDILDNQILGNWDKLSYNAVVEGNKVIVKIPRKELEFVFDYKTGKLLWIYCS